MLAGQAITQAQVTIIDFPPNGQGSVILSGVQPAGRTLSFNGQVNPPAGTEALVIQAQAQGFPQSAQAQCSFFVARASQCQTACDCPTGELCTEQFVCEVGVTPVYCCEAGPCPAGATCQHLAGHYDPCVTP